MLSFCHKKPASLNISGLFFIVLISSSNLSFAAHPEPFLSRNESPFSIIYGLPLSSSAKLLATGKSRWTSSLNISNTINSQSNSQSNSQENLFIDVETWHINFLHDYSFKENWMFRVQLPYIMHSGGIFDATIDSYHNALGLPEDIRPEFPRDEINIQVQQNKIQQLNINSQQQSLGDISLQVAWQARQSEQSALSYWLSVKLPSGDADKLTGSGATDIATWAAMDYRLNSTRWIYGQGGLLYLGNSDVLKDIQKNWGAFANIGIKFQPWNALELKTQLDFHSAFYDSNLKFLGEALQLTFGGTYHINKKHNLDFSITEDIAEGASPDVNFNITWSVYY